MGNMFMLDRIDSFCAILYTFLLLYNQYYLVKTGQKGKNVRKLYTRKGLEKAVIRKINGNGNVDTIE